MALSVVYILHFIKKDQMYFCLFLDNGRRVMIIVTLSFILSWCNEQWILSFTVPVLITPGSSSLGF